MKKKDLTTAEQRYYFQNSKRIVDEFVSAVYRMKLLYLSCEYNDCLTHDDMEFLARRNNLTARELEIIFEHVEDLDDVLFY